PGVLAVGPRDQCSVTGVRVELTKSRGSRPRRFTSLRTRSYRRARPSRAKLQARVLHPTVRAYEAQLSAGSPASKSDQGEIRTPTPKRHDVLSVACLPVPSLGHVVCS